ncbi:MAG: endo-1,4-beta-xylanase [Bryobacteraceae bacterium]|nr:endo-1,4-beta-xylanase [Bryobacteraceae bacterium]
MRPIALLLFLQAALLAQPVSLLPDDVFSAFRQSGSPLQVSIVDVEGQPFTRAWRLRTPDANTNRNAWDIRIIGNGARAVTEGETIVATFWARTIEAPPGSQAYTRFVFEQNGPPYDKSTETPIAPPAEWRRYQIAFTSRARYEANPPGYSVHFWVTYGPQTIEIGGLSVMSHGNTPIRDLGIDGWPYDGASADAPWRAPAAERIEQLRKGDIVVEVRGDDGQPLPAAAVRVRMKKHAFPWGSAIDGGTLLSNTKYQEMTTRLFNHAVLENDLKWPQWEGNRQRALNAVRWLNERGISVRGHNLVWPGSQYLPSDVRTMLAAPSPDPAALRRRVNDHIRNIVEATKGQLIDWDVINEAVANKDIQRILGDAEMGEWFRMARAGDSQSKLYINDYNILAAGGMDIRHQDAYYEIIRYLDSIGAPVDGIGMQGHFAQGTPPERMLQILDRFGALGKEIKITEYDFNSSDEELQAQFTRDLLTVCFSHPAVKGFLLWGFWEQRHWLPRGAMYRSDWSAKPMAAVWDDMIYKQWWTDVSGQTDAQGVFRTRGFLGDYDIEISAGGRNVTVSLRVASNTAANTVTVPVNAPSIAAVVNSANFREGAVAPRQLITIWARNLTSAPATRVFFDDREVPAYFPLADRVTALTPDTLSASPRLVIEHQGRRSEPVTLSPAPAAPGVFTLNQAGSGTIVSHPPGPYRRGDSLAFWFTGDARASSLTVTVGGRSCPLEFRGEIFPGVTQVNIRIPDDAPLSLEAPLVLTVAGASSQPGITVPVQ